MLNLAHDWLHIYLPHALKKIDRVTFGIMSEVHCRKGGVPQALPWRTASRI